MKLHEQENDGQYYAMADLMNGLVSLSHPVRDAASFNFRIGIHLCRKATKRRPSQRYRVRTT